MSGAGVRGRCCDGGVAGSLGGSAQRQKCSDYEIHDVSTFAPRVYVGFCFLGSEREILTAQNDYHLSFFHGVAVWHWA